jgi:hypothetical protein
MLYAARAGSEEIRARQADTPDQPSQSACRRNTANLQ